MTSKNDSTHRRTAPLARTLKRLGACDNAVAWAKTQPSAAAAWRTCERGDWLLWIVGRLSGPPGSPSRRKLVGCASEVARQALPLFEARYPEDGRVRACLDTCDRYARGEPTIEQVREAGSSAGAAGAAGAAYASSAASHAAYASAAAAAAAAAAAGAAYAAAAYYAYAAGAHYAYAAGAHARAGSLRESAEIVRRWYPRPPRARSVA